MTSAPSLPRPETFSDTVTEPSARRQQAGEIVETSLLELVNVLLRWRRSIVFLGALGLVAGITSALINPRVYTSIATFIPQGAESGTSGLALAASQFGIRVPTTGSVWSPAVYAELLRSRALLIPIISDTIVVDQSTGRRGALADQLEITIQDPQLRAEHGYRKINALLAVNQLKTIGAVELSVTTESPDVSFALAERLVEGVDRFNLETRKSQAISERRFVETQAQAAADSLRAAENRLLSFLQRNRLVAGSSELAFERDRLQRDVSLRTQVYTTLLLNLDEARMREVRDTPVITILESPRLPVMPQPRGTLKKGFLGGVAGVLLAVLIAFVFEGIRRAREQPSPESREFFQLVANSLPRFLKRAKV